MIKQLGKNCENYKTFGMFLQLLDKAIPLTGREGP
jgi:hypothetical protein